MNNINGFFEEPILQEMKSYAKQYHVPIIGDEGLHFLVQTTLLCKAKKVLEIGTAIGYSSIALSLKTGVQVTSIERNHELYLEAKKNVEKANLHEKIQLIEADALEIDENSLGEYDLIFIDAAKAQYVKFFEKYQQNLSPSGVIVSDNLLFHGQIEDPQLIESRNRRQLISKIDKFNHWVTSKDDFYSVIYPIGDGMAVSIKKTR